MVIYQLLNRFFVNYQLIIIDTRLIIDSSCSYFSKSSNGLSSILVPHFINQNFSKIQPEKKKMYHSVMNKKYYTQLFKISIIWYIRKSNSSPEKGFSRKLHHNRSNFRPEKFLNRYFDQNSRYRVTSKKICIPPIVAALNFQLALSFCWTKFNYGALL